MTGTRTPSRAARDRFLDAAIAEGLYSSRTNLDRYLEFTTAGAHLEGARVLDIGGGSGLLTLYAGAMGATAVCLEPEGAGSSSGASAVFARVADRLGVAGRVSLRSEAFQDFRSDAPFDVLLLANSVNHLDEDAVVRLRDEEEARERYRSLFRRMAAMAAPGCRIVVTDCDRSNLFGDLGLRSPFCPSIEWRKHQHPSLWCRLLADAGFGGAAWTWSAPNSVPRWARPLFSNRLVAYALLSHFRVTARAEGRPGTRRAD